MRAPMNEDERAKRANKEMDPYLAPSMPWTTDENRMLVGAHLQYLWKTGCKYDMVLPELASQQWH